MNERPRGGNNPSDNDINRLTSPGANTYAKDGVLFMASENTKDQENQPRDPIETPLTISNFIDIPAKTTEQLRAKAAWSQLYGGKIPPDPEERQRLTERIEAGEPPDAAMRQRTGQDTEKQREREARQDADQDREGKRKKSNRKEQLRRPEDDGPQITTEMTQEQEDAETARWLTSMDNLLKQEMTSLHKDKDYFEVMQDRFARRDEWLGEPGKADALEREFNAQYALFKDREKAREFLLSQGFRPEEITDEQIDLAIDQIKETLTIPSRMERIKEQIAKTDDLDTARNHFERLRNYVREINDSQATGKLQLTDQTRAVLREVSDLGDNDLDTLEKIREQTRRILADDPKAGLNIKNFFFEVESVDTKRRGSRGVQIRSLEELVELIAESQGGKFSPGGEFEIMNERGEIQLQNLVAWIRQRILTLHDNEPDDPINTFTNIAVPTFFRQISLNEMFLTPTYFQKRKLVIEGSEEKGDITMRQESVDNQQYENFKMNLLFESWLFGVSHSNNAEYRMVRGQEEPLFNKIASLYAKNQFTKDRNRFLNIFSLAKVDKKEFDAVGKKEEQGSVGRAIQRGVLAYYHLWELASENPIKRDRHGNPIMEPDLDANGKPQKDKDGKTKMKPVRDLSKDITKIENNNFYSTLGADGTQYFYHSMIDQLLTDKGKNEIDFKEAFEQLTANITRGENEEGLTDLELAFRHKRTEFNEFLSKHLGIDAETIGKYESNPRKFAEAVLGKVWGFKHSDLNIFDAVDKEQRIIKLVNKAISAAVGRKEGLGEQDTEYAGEWAFTMRDWTGIAARNDTSGIGFDAWSKLINFQDYRGRQGRGRSGAGNMYNFPGFKRLGVTLLDGLLVRMEGEERKDEKKKSLITVLEESNRNNTKLKTFDFDGEAMKQFSANHINNAFKVFQFILEKMETKMSSVVSVDKLGRPVFNHEAALQIMDGLWHDLRYAFDQPRFNYDSTEIEGWENRTVYDDKGKPVFDDEGKLVMEKVKVTQTMREHMFGEEMIELGHKMHHRKITESVWGRQMARSAMAYLVAKEIHSHRDWDSGYARWPIEQIELIEAFFHHQALEFGQKGEHDYDMKIFEEFFDHHEWKEILKLAKNSYRKMYAGEYAIQGGSLVGGMIGKTIGETIKQVSTIAK